MPVEYVLQTPSADPLPAPELDASQRAVVDHRGDPLLVLAGPGTGKTTTLVEVVVDRVHRGGLRPEEILVLTFSRKAAEELKARISRRLARTTTTATAMTFHSFCYGLVREFSDPDAYSTPTRLLSAAEQDWRIQEILTGSYELGRIDWPAALQPALRTRGLARELADFLARARALGMSPDDVARVAVETGRSDWSSAAQFFGEYLDVLGLAGEVDYAELVHRARQMVTDDELGPQVRDRFRLVVVDEYQDTDPAQVALLQALVAGRGELMAVGDPDQSIYGFRGADVSGVWNFGRDFARADRTPQVAALTTTRRFGSRLLDASRAVIGRLGITGHLDAEAFEAFRRPATAADEPGSLVVQTFATAAAEAEHIALLLRRAHLERGLDWHEMAVLVRSGVNSIPRLQRALVAAGVPVEVAGDEIPLSSQPAVRALLDAARVAEMISRGQVPVPEAAHQLLTGPLGHVEATDLRRLARRLRQVDAEATGDPRPSGELVAEALVQPADWLVAGRGQDAPAARAAHGLATTLGRAAAQIQARESPEQVLWTLWDSTGWPRRLERAALDGGDGALAAHRDLDAVMALFDAAARAEERRDRIGLGPFLDDLEAQEIPGDALGDRGVRGAAVRLMTAHRAKGLEWPLVVVAGVQEGSWPQLRFRGSLLQSELLDPEGHVPRPSTASVVAEERRLFYVAITRARSELVVTAVHSAAEDGDQPSRFLAELAPYATTYSAAPLRRPLRPMSLRGVVTELRSIAESADSEQERAAVAQRLVAIAESGAIPEAGPASWWGLAEWTANATPVRPPDAPLELSGSAISGIVDCPLSWFLSREAKAEQATTSAQGFGLAVHALAADVVHDGLVDDTVLARHLDAVWHELTFAAPWIGERERDAAHDALRRFAHWHNDRGDRTPIASEHAFDVTIGVGDDVVRLRGSMDRIEIDAAGLVHVVDFKTGKGTVSGAELAEHTQLGAYQLAVGHGAVADHTLSGGAELVMLRQPAGTRRPDDPKVHRQPPPDPDLPFFAYRDLARARDVVRAEDFAATLGPACAHCDFRQACPAQPEGRSIVADPLADPPAEEQR